MSCTTPHTVGYRSQRSSSPEYTCVVCRFGVKGPVYMKNRENQVVAVGQDGRCEWQSGSLRKHSNRITTTSAIGTSTFGLFDHITVSHRSEL